MIKVNLQAFKKNNIRDLGKEEEKMCPKTIFNDRKRRCCYDVLWEMFDMRNAATINDQSAGIVRWVRWTTSIDDNAEQSILSSLTEEEEADVKEYRPVSRYRNPDDWEQVTSSFTEPRIWILNGE